MISLEVIEKRKEVIVKDILAVKQRLTEYENKNKEDIALLNALTGALQQCDLFVKELHDDTPKEDSDVENNES
jgi:hypothetical protein